MNEGNQSNGQGLSGEHWQDGREEVPPNNHTPTTGRHEGRAIEGPFSEKVRARFWNKVSIKGPTECWEWKAAVLQSGYGSFRFQGQSLAANRFSFVLTHGLIPFGLFVCHHCDNRKCCNPTHLFIGTQKDNMRDARVKGRLAFGDRNGSRIHPERLARGDRSGARLHPERLARGERHGSKTQPGRVVRGERSGQSKLTESQVKEIRSIYSAGHATQAGLAKQFGVGLMTVNYIILRRTWAHV